MKTTLRKTLTTVACILVSIASSVVALSIPLVNDTGRAATVNATSIEIANVARQFLVGDTYYPLNPGPAMTIPSLYYTTLISQVATLSALENPNASTIQATLQALGPYKSLESFKAGYDVLQSAGLIDTPQAFDNSDENFGALRLGIRGYKIKLVNSRIRSTDFSAMGQYTDSSKTESKYAPNVVGFFCNNDANGLLLPLAIKIVDTGLTYTKEDSAGEWQLAKMTLDATELNFQQMFHLVHTHMVSIPIQVEMMRSMATEHPIYALLNYHFFGDMALEYLGGVILFSVDSPYDQSMAFGASGSMRYIYAEFSNTSMSGDFPADIGDNGLEYLPNHRYVKYGATYYSIIKTFVTSYVKAYYDSEDAVQNDSELQTWAARATVSEIKHHFMNGRVSWHSQAAPFSAPALYNTPLPAGKGVDVNPFDYVIPSDVFPLLSYMAVRFYRPVPSDKSVLSAYTTSPFSDETVLEEAIAQFQQSMAVMEVTVDSTEAGETYPDTFVKPSLLPWFSYI
ncbi:hypothetical protein PC129_g11686 [Phytophthora cactorum]|uniref:Lipoxygenase domain-containing protein n=1 Tax=Phytophthora cactorum TaxID=29920 RepID=A0A8T1I061_9STRA|nr:hypothetical protein PC113_g13830 [Phytophthora cactorum]KAG2905554.1 hypothetical protein PC114_g11488 [Phytophthora cactorum]KAG2910829.1 hypothetical protein PC115_g12792 [Phytophthora cactorum]KAG2981864.1 hypothetical protein PC118_g10342 [Phytophthora cactorum]KAG3008227.1 hypothetical protein PC119_g14300 [Phytophthora cactorum]